MLKLFWISWNPAIQLPIWEKENNQLDDAFASSTSNERSKKRLCSKRSGIFKKSSCFFLHCSLYSFFIFSTVHCSYLVSFY